MRSSLTPSSEASTQKRKATEETNEAAKKPHGLIKVLADACISDEEEEELLPESESCSNCKETDEEKTELRRKLAMTEMKFLRLANTLEQVHSAIDPLQQRLLRFAGSLGKHLDMGA